MAKSGKAFRTIGETEAIINVQQHILRYWEDQIEEIRPLRRASRPRLYHPSVLQLLSGVKKLIDDEGMTVRAVQKVIKEKGVDYVSSLNPISLDDDPPKPNDLSTEETPQNERAKDSVSEKFDDQIPTSSLAGQSKSDSDLTRSCLSQEKINKLKKIYSRLEILKQRMETTVQAL